MWVAVRRGVLVPAQDFRHLCWVLARVRCPARVFSEAVLEFLDDFGKLWAHIRELVMMSLDTRAKVLPVLATLERVHNASGSLTVVVHCRVDCVFLHVDKQS